MSKMTRAESRARRHLRVRKRVTGTPERPRLNVYRSLEHIYVQLIDDSQGVTLASASSVDADLRARLADMKPVEQAKLVGSTVAERARARGVTRVIFDRGGYRYHGRVKALADGAREGGLEF